MCTTIIDLAPRTRWPAVVAFIRDEDRRRPTAPVAAWWPEQPTWIGGRDERAGGTWLLVDTSSQRIAFVQNALGVAALEPRTSRGTIPFELLRSGVPVAQAQDVHAMDPFIACLIEPAGGLRWWHWDGRDHATGQLVPGLHMITREGVNAAATSARQRRWRSLFGRAARVDPAAGWSPWIELLDRRAAAATDASELIVTDVPGHPHFGTVGASLVGLGRDAQIAYWANGDPHLDREAWHRVDIGAFAR